MSNEQPTVIVVTPPQSTDNTSTETQIEAVAEIAETVGEHTAEIEAVQETQEKVEEACLTLEQKTEALALGLAALASEQERSRLTLEKLEAVLTKAAEEVTEAEAPPVEEPTSIQQPHSEGSRTEDHANGEPKEPPTLHRDTTATPDSQPPQKLVRRL